jgi:competence protein ComEA
MAGVSPEPDRLLPPRPAPPRTLGEVARGWLAWFGVARLLLTVLSIALVGAGAHWLLRAPSPEAAVALPVAGAADAPAGSAATLPPPATQPAPTTLPGPLVVHVAGRVVRPGVYSLPHGSRVVAAIDAAGGATAEADLDGLNLASVLVDGQRVYVPATGEVDPGAVDDGVPPATAANDHATPGDAPGSPVDLNAATVGELEALPGVGPATAAAIVDDRQRNGPFASVDDLDRVPGIGPAKLAALIGLVTV